MVAGSDVSPTGRDYGHFRAIMAAEANAAISGAWNAGASGKALWGVGIVAALLTAYYMSRQVFLVFFGSPRWAGEAADGEAHEAREAAEETELKGEELGEATVSEGHAPQPHESPWLMTAPLVVLAVLAAVGGGLNLPFTSDTLALEHWLEPVFEDALHHSDASSSLKVQLALVAVVVIAAGLTLFLQRTDFGLGVLAFVRLDAERSLEQAPGAGVEIFEHAAVENDAGGIALAPLDAQGAAIGQHNVPNGKDVTRLGTGMDREGPVLPSGFSYFASGSGRSWKCTTSGFVPLPPSISHGVRSPLVVHRPRPFQPAFGSSMRPSRPLA